MADDNRIRDRARAHHEGKGYLAGRVVQILLQLYDSFPAVNEIHDCDYEKDYPPEYPEGLESYLNYLGEDIFPGPGEEDEYGKRYQGSLDEDFHESPGFKLPTYRLQIDIKRNGIEQDQKPYNCLQHNLFEHIGRAP